MAFKIWSMFVTTGLCLIKMPFGCVSKECPTEDEVTTPFSGVCRVKPMDTLCLVCPINISASYIVWGKNGQIIIRGEHQVGIGTYKLNSCHSIFKSLEVTIFGSDQHHEEFTCFSDTIPNITSKFTVAIEAQTSLHIQELENVSIGHHPFRIKGSEILLKCELEKAFGDVTLTWAVNGTENAVIEHEYYHEDKLNGKYISVIRYSNSGSSDNITCRSYGPYIQNITVSWVSNASVPGEDTKKFPEVIIIMIPFLATTGVIVIITLYCFKTKHTGTKTLSKPSNDSTVSVNSESLESSHVSEDHVTPSKDQPVLYTRTKCLLKSSDGPKVSVCSERVESSEDHEVPAKDQPVLYSQVVGKKRGSEDLNEDSVRAVLQDQIKSTSNYDYWKGKWLTSQHEEKYCFMKTLSEECSLKNAYDFKILAGSLSTLQTHGNIVNILSSFIEEVPYVIYYEYMAFGTLRDVITSRYRQAKDTTLSRHMDLKSQTEEFVSFSYDIAEAMIYITSNNFSHPALSARKVLLTGNGGCKLYDIYPMEMAICRINEVMKKKYPPVAWLAPETIFLNEYSCASDMWNFAVVLWEIFSIGDIPYKGMTQTQVEQNIKQSIPLNQPLYCPGALYSMMLSCWVTARTERPTFENIRNQLFNVKKS